MRFHALANNMMYGIVFKKLLHLVVSPIVQCSIDNKGVRYKASRSLIGGVHHILKLIVNN